MSIEAKPEELVIYRINFRLVSQEMHKEFGFLPSFSSET